MARPRKPSKPSHPGLGAAVTLGVLTVLFLIIPLISGKPTHTIVSSNDPPRPTFSNPTPTAEFYGPVQPDDIGNRPLPQYDGTPAWSPSQEFAHKLQQVMFMLILVGLLAWACLRMVNRFFPGVLQAGPGSKKRLMQILERQSLAPGINLALVRIGEKTLVLGMTEHSVNNICELTQAEWEALEAQRAADAPKPAMSANAGENYRQILNHYLSILPGMGAPKS